MEPQLCTPTRTPADASVSSPRTPGSGSYVPPHVQQLLEAQRRGLEEQNQLLMRHRAMSTPRRAAAAAAAAAALSTPASGLMRHAQTQTPITGSKRKATGTEPAADGVDSGEFDEAGIIAPPSLSGRVPMEAWTEPSACAASGTPALPVGAAATAADAHLCAAGATSAAVSVVSACMAVVPPSGPGYALSMATAAEHSKRLFAVQDEILELRDSVSCLKANLGRFRHDVLSVQDAMQAEIQRQAVPFLAAVRERDAEYERLLHLYKDEARKRRKLHNELQELKGNIRVFARIRPLAPTEATAEAPDGVVQRMDEHTVHVDSVMGRPEHTFEFDAVFAPDSSQETVFRTMEPLVVSVVDGYNVCCFAYGQTGSGKTYTMEGTADQRGVSYRTLDRLFGIATERASTTDVDIRVSMLEIYNEQIVDLLAGPRTDEKRTRLDVRTGPHGNIVPGLTVMQVSSIEQVVQAIATGSANRATGSTNMNEHSSRSHCLLSLCVTATDRVSGAKSFGKLHLVDLAGSERASRSEATGQRLLEAQHINKSLSALGNVISALVARSPHIPYRDSKLTFLLQDSLSGDSKTVMFVNVSPAAADGLETISSLKFAARVRNVEVGPATKHTDNAELLRAKKALKAKEEACAKLEQELEQLRSRSTVMERQLGETRDRSALNGAELQKANARIRKLEEMLVERDQQLRAVQADSSSARAAHQEAMAAELARAHEQIARLEASLRDRERQWASERASLLAAAATASQQAQAHVSAPAAPHGPPVAATPAPLKSALKSTPSVSATVAGAVPRFALPAASSTAPLAAPGHRDEGSSSGGGAAEVRFAAKPVFLEETPIPRPTPRAVNPVAAAASLKDITPPDGRRLTRGALAAVQQQQQQQPLQPASAVPPTPVVVKTREQLLSEYLAEKENQRRRPAAGIAVAAGIALPPAGGTLGGGPLLAPMAETRPRAARTGIAAMPALLSGGAPAAVLPPRKPAVSLRAAGAK